MRKAAPAGQRRQMAKRTTARQRREPVLTLKLEGPGVRPGRITVPELLVLCEKAQAAVNRQAEAAQGRRTLRPGPATEKVRGECTLELASLRKGSTLLGFDLAKAQQSLPTHVSFGEEVIGQVIDAIDALEDDKAVEIDPGVLDSLQGMGAAINGRVRSIKWLARASKGRRRKSAVLNKRVVKHIALRLKVPSNRVTFVEGMVEMADFGPTDQRCRIHPVFGPPIACTFDESISDVIYNVLRKPAKFEGEAAINPHTGRIETIAVTKVTPIQPLSLGAKNFFDPPNLEELAKMQAVSPLEDIRTLAGGWPDDEDIDPTQ